MPDNQTGNRGNTSTSFGPLRDRMARYPFAPVPMGRNELAALLDVAEAAQGIYDEMPNQEEAWWPLRDALKKLPQVYPDKGEQ